MYRGEFDLGPIGVACLRAVRCESSHCPLRRCLNEIAKLLLVTVSLALALRSSTQLFPSSACLLSKIFLQGSGRLFAFVLLGGKRGGTLRGNP